MALLSAQILRSAVRIAFIKMNTTLLKLNWTVDQFQSHTKPGHYIKSPYFEPSNEFKINLDLSPNGFAGSSNGVNILLHFESSKFSEMDILYKFALINSQGKHVHTKGNIYNDLLANQKTASSFLSKKAFAPYKGVYDKLIKEYEKGNSEFIR